MGVHEPIWFLTWLSTNWIVNFNGTIHVNFGGNQDDKCARFFVVFEFLSCAVVFVIWTLYEKSSSPGKDVYRLNLKLITETSFDNRNFIHLYPSWLMRNMYKCPAVANILMDNLCFPYMYMPGWFSRIFHVPERIFCYLLPKRSWRIYINLKYFISIMVCVIRL